MASCSYFSCPLRSVVMATMYWHCHWQSLDVLDIIIIIIITIIIIIIIIISALLHLLCDRFLAGEHAQLCFSTFPDLVTFLIIVLVPFCASLRSWPPQHHVLPPCHPPYHRRTWVRVWTSLQLDEPWVRWPSGFPGPNGFFGGWMGVDCKEEMKMKWELSKSISFMVLDVAFSAIFSIASKNLSLSSIKRTIHPLLPRCGGVNAEPAAEYHSCLFSSLWDNCAEVSKGQNQG